MYIAESLSSPHVRVTNGAADAKRDDNGVSSSCTTIGGNGNFGDEWIFLRIRQRVLMNDIHANVNTVTYTVIAYFEYVAGWFRKTFTSGKFEYGKRWQEKECAVANKMAPRHLGTFMHSK